MLTTSDDHDLIHSAKCSHLDIFRIHSKYWVANAKCKCKMTIALFYKIVGKMPLPLHDKGFQTEDSSGKVKKKKPLGRAEEKRGEWGLARLLLIEFKALHAAAQREATLILML